jgi:hypothetical protein
VAYRTCADHLEGATAPGRLDLGPQVAAYRFSQGGERVTVLWSRDGQPQTVVLPVRPPQARVIGMLGAERTAAAPHGTLRLAITGDPTYIREAFSQT